MFKASQGLFHALSCLLKTFNLATLGSFALLFKTQKEYAGSDQIFFLNSRKFDEPLIQTHYLFSKVL